MMDTRLFLPLSILPVIALYILLSSLPSLAEVRLQVSEESTLKSITTGNDKTETQKISANTPTSINLSTPTELSSPSLLPVVLIPVYSRDADIRVDSPKIKEVISQIKEGEVQLLLSQIMGSLHDVQNLIQKRKLDEALTRLQTLETKYPSIQFFGFTRASIFLLQGKREEALRVAKDSLRQVPDYEEGKLFVKKLQEGAKR